MNRRNFLKNSGFASTALMVPSFLQSYVANTSATKGKTLIIVQLSGGNDGLNTIVPYRNDIYYKKRPKLSIKKEELIRVDDELGFHPSLKTLKNVYDDGLMSIINSVGYPNPDRSHFRSMDIWQTGSGSEEYWSSGWLGRYLDSDCSGCENPYQAIEVDDSLSLALKGKSNNGFAVSHPRELKKATDNSFLKSMASQQVHQEEENLAYLYKTMIDTQSSADYLYKQAKTYDATVSYPNSSFARDLKCISSLMTSGTDTRVYYVSIGGFDTHASQKGKQKRLLKEYAEGISAFIKDLKNHRLLSDTMIMTFSEFGRRVKQNASGGTDHGTANNVFLMGGDLPKQGFFNEAPDLTDLDNGDLKYKIDFRSIYASLLDNWLETDAKAVLGGYSKKLF
ncbi:MAG: DUF1501 domain-containing protein [Saprospiraceae bacterium]